MNLNSIISTLILGGFFIPFQPVFALEKPPLFLRVGEQRVLKFSHLDRYSVSGSSIRYTRIPENRLLIKGVRPGTGTLMIAEGGQTKTQLIQVETKLQSPYPVPLFQALSLLKETEAIDSGVQFILRGKVNSLSEARTISKLKVHFPTWILDETELDRDWIKINVREIQTLIQPHSGLRLFTEDGFIAIQGVVSNEFSKEALVKKIHSIQPLAVLDIQTLQGFSPTLYFKVFLLEVKKEIAMKLGTEIQQPLQGTILTSTWKPLLDPSIGVSIQALSEKGWVKVLSAPELVVKSPGQAELFAGGEMPLRLRNRNEDRIAWKNVGLSLKLDVKEYNGEKVRLQIETELNHLNSAFSQNNLPGIKTNRIKTQVEGTMGKPLLLSGLLQEDWREKISGLPGLSEIPILGRLFGSEDYQKDRSELVAVLLPYREPPRDPMQRISSDLPKGYLPLPRNFIQDEEVRRLQSSKEYPWNAL